MSIEAALTIGQLAQAAGVNVETVRFYQRRGLLSEPDRPTGSIRRYSGVDTERIRFIKAAQRLGFSLDDVEELLRLEDGTHCGQARRLAERKLGEIRSKIDDLRCIESTLDEMVSRCCAVRGKVSCPLIAAVAAAATSDSVAQPTTSTRPAPTASRSTAGPTGHRRKPLVSGRDGDTSCAEAGNLRWAWRQNPVPVCGSPGDEAVGDQHDDRITDRRLQAALDDGQVRCLR